MVVADWSETSTYATSSAKGDQSSEGLKHSGDGGRAYSLVHTAVQVEQCSGLTV